ncbi:hypothetical protein RYZ20_06110 [Thioclava sp. A2]|nr:hypothetical protein [Thioclava sp. A2]
MFDSGDPTPEQEVDNADLTRNLALLDETQISEMEAALGQDPLLAQGEVETEDDLLLPYVDENGFADIEGGEGRDLIVIPEEVGEEHDAVFGNGGGGDDLILGGSGSDVLYGGAGNDNIIDNADGDENNTDVIVAGEGDDGLIIEDGINLVSLGAGHDHLMIYSESGDNPGAVVTDFNPEEDALLLGVYAPGIDLPEGTNSLELGYTLSEIQTDPGAATLVTPASSDAVTAETLGEGASVGYAVLLGVSPADLASVEIRVVLQNDQTVWAADDSIEKIAQDMGATRL